MPISISRPRRVFKDMLGQANHHLVTILVGLHAVTEHGVTAPAGLRAAWSPKSRKESARRARLLAMSAAMAWAVDSLDAYASLALRLPSLVERQSLRDDLNGAGRSVFAKVAALRKAYPGETGSAGALVALTVVWRNHLVHALADNDIPPELRLQLLGAKDEIEKQYRGLDVARALSGAGFGRTPTLKEAASAVAACHAFVAAVDAALLSDVSLARYLTDVLRDHFHQPSPSGLSGDRLATLWGKELSRRERSIHQILQNEAGVAFPDSDIEAWASTLARASLTEARAQLGRTSA